MKSNSHLHFQALNIIVFFVIFAAICKIQINSYVKGNTKIKLKVGEDPPHLSVHNH